MDRSCDTLIHPCISVPCESSRQTGTVYFSVDMNRTHAAIALSIDLRSPCSSHQVVVNLKPIEQFRQQELEKKEASHDDDNIGPG